mmetsp:Transcript_19753/g.41386  ORF Transcript_19753/g.41386 Transcript_19753/m.41386 type:complete len:196 (+) Transcript_19753:565-1152(+)
MIQTTSGRFVLVYPMQLSLGSVDIIPLLNCIFHFSYRNERANRKTVADSRWYPLNRKLLKYEELLNDSKTPTMLASPQEMEENSELSGFSAVTLNIHEGMAGNCLDRMIKERARSLGAKRTADKRKRKGEAVVSNLKKVKRLSSGVLVRHGIHSLNDPCFLFANFTMMECATYLQYKKVPSKDPCIPKELGQRHS